VSEPTRPHEHQGTGGGTVHLSDGTRPESRCTRCGCSLGHYYEPGSRVALVEPTAPKGSWRTFWKPDCPTTTTGSA
jgi:hypothetical protein